MRAFKILFLTAFGMSLSACGGGGYSVSGVPKPAATPALTAGNWSLQAIPNSSSSGVTPTDYSGPLSVSGSTVSVTTLPNGNCFPVGTPIVISGQTSGSSITLASQPSTTTGFALTIAGTNNNGTNIGGTFQIAGGTNSSSCIASVGTVYGTLVPPLNGSWSGTVTENAYGQTGDPTAPADYVPNIAGITLALTQASAPQTYQLGGGVTKIAFPLSGTVTWTNSQCFGSGTIDPTQSFVLGGVVQISVINAAGAYPTYAIGNPLGDPSTATRFVFNLDQGTGACAAYSINGSVTKS
jgi:hypothetical protein